MASGDTQDPRSEEATAANVDDATKLAVIADRFDDDVFPVVEPAEQNSLSQCDAQEVLAWVQKEHTVLIQSYINEQYEKFRSAADVLPGEGEKLYRAQWSRDHYYKHLARNL